MLVRDPHRLGDVKPRAHNDDRRRRNGGMMRASKTEDAMAAAGMVGNSSRNARSITCVLQAERKGRRTVAGIRRNGKAAQRDKQALRRHRVSDDDADQRPPVAPQADA
jgi:hypothetical protein